MNCCFYLAIDRLPLATVAAIEFLPVIGLAALGARTRAQPRGARAGRLRRLPAHRRPPRGRRRSASRSRFANAALFALYIVLADRVAKRPALDGVDGLGAAMLVAAVVVTPLAGWAALPAFGDPVALIAGVGVGSQLVGHPLRLPTSSRCARLPRATYA